MLFSVSVLSFRLDEVVGDSWFLVVSVMRLVNEKEVVAAAGNTDAPFTVDTLGTAVDAIVSADFLGDVIEVAFWGGDLLVLVAPATAGAMAVGGIGIGLGGDLSLDLDVTAESVAGFGCGVDSIE